MSKKIYLARLKTRKQIMAEIPREQQGWWADVCPGETLELRDATAADIGRCIINEGQSRDPADYLCETFKGGALVNRIAVAELAEIAPAAPVPASTGRELIEYRAGADDVWHSAPLSERESLVKDGFQVRALIVARELDVEAERLTVEEIVELADQSEWTDPETGRLQFDRLGFAQAVERKVLAARNAAQSTQPESAQVSTEQAGDAWISVEDRLPKPYEEVIVWPHPTDYCMTAEFYGRSASGRPVWKYGEYENGWGHSNVEITAPVTHWQPKPAAPSPNNSPVGEKD